MPKVWTDKTTVFSNDNENLGQKSYIPNLSVVGLKGNIRFIFSVESTRTDRILNTIATNCRCLQRNELTTFNENPFG